MPHITLEYSSNVTCQQDFSFLFRQLHDILADTAGINPDNCKSRSRRADTYFVASGREADAFVHLDIRFLKGRLPEIRQAVGKSSINLLKNWFKESVDALDLQITVEVREITPCDYFKYPEGTLPLP